VKLHKFVTSGLVLAFVLSSAWIPVAAAPAADGGTRQISAGGTTSFASAPPAVDGAIQDPEFAPSVGADNASAPTPQLAVNKNFKGVDRSHSHSAGNDHGTNSGHDDHSNPQLSLSFDGLNFRQQRLANGGNQFSVEPPDQGLCVGNGFVVESVNDVLHVFHADGSSASPIVDLNTFYGYIPAIQRSTGVRGPFVTDPSCLYDSATQRFYHIVLTLDTTPRGAFTGPNHLDLAVSQTADPTGAWTIYRLPVQDDGTAGTPNHGCTDGAGGAGPCLGDYPHIGADANGLYVTTNEYEFFGNAFVGAQIYAFSKAQLAAGGAVAVTQIDTSHSAPGNKPGFTVWPAQGSGRGGEDDKRGDDGARGKEYFLSSTAADEAQCASLVVCSGTGSSKNILLWTLRGTASLNSATPALTLSNRSVKVDTYSIPPKSNQKAGDFPLGQCINDTTTVVTSLGPPFTGCWQALFGAEPAHTEILSHPDSNDTRMQQVTFANGKVWGALDTDVIVKGVHKAGIEYFAVATDGHLDMQGTLALAGNNLTYPAIGMLPNGKGVMAFTVLGDKYYPSAGYAGLSAEDGAGAIHIAAAGLGPDDGFTSYKSEVGDPPRTRWGDYGAAAVDGSSIWIASEYIAQTCNLAQYVSAPFGSCGGTRATLGNWATRISKIAP
jgi:hypothetical protein